MADMDRAQVLAHRVAAHGLHRASSDPAELAVFDLGVQDITQRATAELALAARLPDTVRRVPLAEDERFTLAWSLRGAPHYHRASDYAGLPPALLPLDDADAQARLSWQRGDIAQAGIPAREAVTTAAQALRDVVTTTMAKGAASRAVSRVLPDGLTRWCRNCRATHIPEQLMRLAGPLAGLRLEAGASPATLAPMRPRPGVPTRTDVPAATRLVAHYLRVHGPASATEAAGFLGTSRATVAGHLWPGDLVAVRVRGRRLHA